jgi:hypothetical protein
VAYYDVLSKYFGGGNKKNTKILTQDNWCSSRDLNWVSPEYKSEAFTVEPARSLPLLCVIFITHLVACNPTLQPQTLSYKNKILWDEEGTSLVIFNVYMLVQPHDRKGISG